MAVGSWEVLQATTTMGCVARETYSNLINGLSSCGLLYANIIGVCTGGTGNWGGGSSIGCQVSIGAYNMRLLMRLSPIVQYIVTYCPQNLLDEPTNGN